MDNCFRLPRPKPDSRPNQTPQYLAIEPEPDGLDVPKGPEVHLEAGGFAEAGGGTDLRLEKFKITSLNFDDVGGDRGVDAPVVVINGGGGGGASIRPKPESRPNQAPQYLAIESEPDGDGLGVPPGIVPFSFTSAEAGGFEAYGFAEAGGGTDLWLEKFKIKSLNFDDVGGDRGVDAPVVVINEGGGGKK